MTRLTDERVADLSEWIRLEPRFPGAWVHVSPDVLDALLTEVRAHRASLPEGGEALAEAMEDRAAKYGTAAMQPLGVELAPGKKHARHNRDVLSGLSGGLNEAAEMVRAAPSPAAGDLARRARLCADGACPHLNAPECLSSLADRLAARPAAGEGEAALRALADEWEHDADRRDRVTAGQDSVEARMIRAVGETERGLAARLRAALSSPSGTTSAATEQRTLPCGCVTCVCKTEDRCLRCGAREAPACQTSRLSGGPRHAAPTTSAKGDDRG